MGLIVVIVVVVIVIVVAVLVTRSRRSDDGVEGFRRQIDALSSDARRPTIDRRAADEAKSPESTPPADEPDARDDGPSGVPDTVQGEPDGT